ncbi:hypothetical protein VR7878_03205 [Vibrio ruber DSM 16370]|uniref:Uncharacterized protein n=1 Tax=Vibrio ruber (strain DSM 16370 / JCM 11486 / BCRC 17186 / CECT 7878 / LMG 23124 / VR1) TaxID=1123498 RepID=A0A1R4LRR3_VIBR1|nr:hypothetical protein [Vibrio ruber]SJN59069.1 hypothetical protein VR7878_03205 [Vibrio ruber DSM 16370]
MKKIIILLFLFTDFSFAHEIVEEYKKLSSDFIVEYIKGSGNAKEIALKQLDIDPSDSAALLRLSISLDDKQCKNIKSYYLELGSENEIQDISRAIIQRRCHFK